MNDRRTLAAGLSILASAVTQLQRDLRQSYPSRSQIRTASARVIDLYRPNDLPPFPPAADAALIDIEERAFKRNRIRLFAVSISLTLLLGLGFTYARPAVYQATAIIVIEPPASQPDVSVSVLLAKERERLMSESLRSAALAVTAGSSAARAETLEAVITANTNLIKLTATGRDPGALSPIVEGWVGAYEEKLARTQAASVAESRTTLEGQLDEFESRIAAKRAETDAFREEHAIVSTETAHKSAPRRLQGVADALEVAREEQVTAVAELASLQQAVAAGRPVGREQDERVIANLESRAQDLREQIREFGDKYTPAYEALDPAITTAKKRLEEVEATLSAKRGEAYQAVMAEAEKNVHSTNARVRALQQDLAEYEGQATTFMSLHEEHQSLQSELSELELQAQAIRNQIVDTEISTRDLFPRVGVLERAILPSTPIRPLYTRDAIISVTGSLLVSVLLTWIYTQLKSPRRVHAARLHPQPNIYSYHTEVLAPGTPAAAFQPPSADAPALQHRGLRELSQVEVDAMLAACAAEDRVLIGLLLSGLTAAEVAGLGASAIDRQRNLIMVDGVAARELPLAPKLAADLDQLGHSVDSFADVDWIHARVAQAPFAAGLSDPASINAAVLRHTYVCFLVRQGVKFDQLPQLVGTLDAGELSRYGEIMPPMTGKGIAEVTPVYPALDLRQLTE